MKKLALIIVAVIAIAGCKKSITGPERDELLKAADPITDSILTGYNSGNYALYSKDFNEQMKNALPENVFTQTREEIMEKVGAYKSRVVSGTYKKNQYSIVEYTAEFENEKEVNVKVVLVKLKDAYLVSGLWYNSPKLRK